MQMARELAEALRPSASGQRALHKEELMRPRWPRKTVVTYWLHYPGGGESQPMMHVDIYPVWAWAVEAILDSHPHWDWWVRMWHRISPYFGDPVCYTYCARWSLIDRSVHHASAPIPIEMVPESERGWMEREILEEREGMEAHPELQ